MHTEESPSFHCNPGILLLSLFSIRGAVLMGMQNEVLWITAFLPSQYHCDPQEVFSP